MYCRLYYPILRSSPDFPAFTGPNNLPVGLQIVGPQDQDKRTLEVAQWVDQMIAKHFGAYPVPIYQ